MTYQLESSDFRTWPDDQMEALFAEGFPDFITEDQAVKTYIGRVREYFPHLNVMLVENDDTPVATGWGVPIAWSGDVADLPMTFADLLGRAVEARDAGEETTTFVMCGAVVHPDKKGTGTASELIRALSNTGQLHGLTRTLAPLRPTRKHLYPLISITEYASWVREDGRAFDPWLRLHLRVGARVIALAPKAQTMTATVGEWEGWTGLSLPASGDYVIPLGMNVLHVDREADVGVYSEPNIWVQHL